MLLFDKDCFLSPTISYSNNNINLKYQISITLLSYRKAYEFRIDCHQQTVLSASRLREILQEGSETLIYRERIDKIPEALQQCQVAFEDDVYEIGQLKILRRCRSYSAHNSRTEHVQKTVYSIHFKRMFFLF